MLEMVKPSNFILVCDSYKFLHWKEIPKTVTKTWVVVVPRSASDYADEIVAMGQTYVAYILANVRITMDMIDEAEIEINEQGYEFNRAGWELIVNVYDGRLPLAMYGVEEGRVIKPQTPILGLINTDDYSAWLPAYVETWVHGAIWSMSTVASICRASRKIIKHYMELSGADMSMLDYKLHNFGGRATGNEESIVMTGIAHAAVFLGSDCGPANRYIKRLYGTSKSFTSSVEATEHSTMCANSDCATKDDIGGATMAINRLKDTVARSKNGIGIPLLSCVIDTFDSNRFVREYIGKEFRDEIILSGGKLVCRPDSGDITKEPKKITLDLMDAFSYTTNAKGYKVLNPCVGVIQGDGLNVKTIESVLKSFTDSQLSIDNLTLGMGHGVTNYGARDDFSFSMKAVANFNAGSWVRLKKDPVTDAGKTSLTGLVRCMENEAGELVVYDGLTNGVVFNFFNGTPGWKLYSIDGKRMYRQSFDMVRKFATV